MAGKTKSDSKKSQLTSEAKGRLQARAVLVYQKEVTSRAAGLPSRGAQAVCNEFMALHKAETGENIPKEVTLAISYIGEIGSRGFPLSHERLKQHVDEIRFVEKHSDRIKMSWATPLDSKRARAVNPHTNTAWFCLLKETIVVYKIVEETTYAADEFGCNGTDGQRERVMGQVKGSPQYQQVGGDRENITVIVAICGDGTPTPPAVIFKGSAFQVSWKQNNPANASYVSLHLTK
ncbi:hypothetical protein BOTBODRAFT_135684 [Botryobasidium botryosum FD-172 SS1]|uniref:Uncharacterized protein n=1 Tax=Botryobasidium botryosum (strain FD-172 SS1) TaxID=930990 RepID=A0A067M7R5_BOTB1|nr:hypothetical protein BOTBODRAFT_135684 [Botryobasidium botryosum FD-172 SS1]